jgi:hypothetical protein
MIMTKKLFALLLAGTLMVPHITPALGNQSTVGVGTARGGASSVQPWGDLQLPPVPHLETMPWLSYGSAAKGSKVDMLWGPKLDTLGPFLVEPAIPPTKLSLSRRPFASSITTE